MDYQIVKEYLDKQKTIVVEKYDFEKKIRAHGGNLKFHVNVDKGYIRDIKIYGDFFNLYDINIIENALTGVKHDPEAILKTLSEFSFDDFFMNFTPAEFVRGMF